MIDRGVFFAHVRAGFGPLQQKQVDGFNAILDVYEARYTKRTPYTQFSVCLATAWHETASTMQPIREYGNQAYFTKLYDVRGKNPVRARKMGNTKPGDGHKYNGRGLVQLTWKVNYERATVELKKLGVLKPGESLVENPELAMRPDIACILLLEGMEQGWFTGVNLDKTVDEIADEDTYQDFIASRRIINGTDKAEKIAGHAKVFLKALLAAHRPDKPAAEPAPQPQPPATATKPKPAEPKGLVASFIQAVKGVFRA